MRSERKRKRNGGFLKVPEKSPSRKCRSGQEFLYVAALSFNEFGWGLSS